MRFAGSIYDNLRQPGVFDASYEETSGDEKRMKRAVLARLRFDDLLANDGSDEGAKIVTSFTDVIDGRLFTLLEPQDLKGIDLEILYFKNIVAKPQDAVLATVRHWIHESDGRGRPVFFMAARAGANLTQVAENIRKQNDLNVTDLDRAKDYLIEAGFQKDDAEALHEHWSRWKWAIADGVVSLHPFVGQAASAAPDLERYLNISESDEYWSPGGDANALFRQSLARLEEANGNWDSAVKLLEEERQASTGDEARTRMVEKVAEVFRFYRFDSIARANQARPEHSASIGPGDASGPSEDLLKRIVPTENQPDRIYLDPRIVAGLGNIPAHEYREVKNETVYKIRSGIHKYKQSMLGRKEPNGGDLSHLHDAFEALAGKVSAVASKSDNSASRRIALAAAAGAVMGGVAVGTGVLEIVLTPVGDAVTIASSVVTPVVAECAKRVGKCISSRLLRRSLVRAAAEELNP